MTLIRFSVEGRPVPCETRETRVARKKGVKRKMMNKDAGDNDAKSWSSMVAYQASLAMNRRKPLSGPLALTLTFCLPRPKSHFRHKRYCIEMVGPESHIKTPEVTRLVKAVEAVLTGIVWNHPAQVTRLMTEKFWGGMPGVDVEVAQCGT